MIKRFYIDNYKSLVNFELPLQELTLLLGANGAGKTAVLDVVFALRQLLSGQAKVTGGRPLFCFEMGDVQLYRDDHSPGPSFGADWTESAIARVPEIMARGCRNIRKVSA